MFTRSKFRLVAALVLFSLLLSLLPSLTLAAEPTKMILATTTSTDDSGLLDNILPDFEKAFNTKVEVVAVGTGQALKLGQDCNADVVLVHSRAQEDKFIADGFGINRQDVMYNDFIILGPPSDPAGIKGMTSAADAFKKIAETGNKFISRGDDSGTHNKEKAVWKAAGIEPAGDWYVSSGLGMGEVLTMANEQLAYTLADRGTYLARTLEGTDLVVLVEGDKVLFNPYGVIAVNPDKCPNVKAQLAADFTAWITSPETMVKISDFKVADQSLFIPDSDAWKDAQAQPEAKMILATTTSTEDSGLLDNILPDFEKAFNTKVEVVAVGTGQALKLGQDCNADVVLVHSRAQEDKFIADGFGINRQDVMYNDFIILGPPSDPAGIKGMTSAADAFKKIAETGNKFISRGDDSGTHNKEKAVWKAAGIEPAGDWYVSSGLGMGEVLTMANEQLAYTLSDRGTYLARTLEGTELVVLVEGDKVLLNPYGVIAVNPAKCPNVKAQLAADFTAWITSPETMVKISDFKVADQSLFIPDSDAWKDAQGMQRITIFHAGSLKVPVQNMADAFKAANPNVYFKLEGGGSVDCAKKVTEKQRPAELVMSADYTVIDELMIPDWASWNIRFARNDMVIVYTDQSKYASEITADNWYEVLMRPDVVFGHSDPNVDPAGYRSLMVWQLAEKHYKIADLYKNLKAAVKPENVKPKAEELVTVVQSGEMDYAWEYRSVAVQNKLKFLELPAEINLSDPALADSYAQAEVEIPGAEAGQTVKINGVPIVYGLTVPKTAERPELGIAFAALAIGPEGQAIMEKAGQPPIVPALVSDVAAVPAELQPLVK